MATPVPPNKNPTPKEYLPPPPTPELTQPADYKVTVKAHKDHRVVSKVRSPACTVQRCGANSIQYHKAEV